MKRLLSLIALALALCVLACSNGEVAADEQASLSSPSVPAVQLAGRVTDEARILSSEQQARLSEQLEQFEEKTRHQIVVVTVSTLNGRDIADFTRDLGRSWGIGRKCHNDGVVLLVAPVEREVRIAVGYGLEQRLTNDICSRIIKQAILPHFRQGDLPGGIQAGTNALIASLS